MDNTLVCFKGNPFEPIDLANMFDLGVRTQAVGSFEVDHYWAAEFSKKAQDDFDRLSQDDTIKVTVYHMDVDPASRICQSCGKQIGTPTW